MTKRKTPLIALLSTLTVASLLFFTSCTEVDKTLGADMIPTGEQQDLVVDTIYPYAFTVTLDSVATGHTGIALIGSTYSPMFGLSEYSTATQLLPFYDSVKFGTNPVCDSLVLELILYRKKGNESARQTIKVYELKKRLYADSTYYASTDPADFYDPTALLGATIYGGEDTLRIRLDKSYGTRLLSTPESAMIKAGDTLATFKDMFKGVYLVSENSLRGSERLNEFNAAALMKLHYSNAEKQDTVCYYYVDVPGLSSSTYIASPRFNAIKHRYDEANPLLKVNHLNDTVPSTGLDSVVYIQGQYGATPYINIAYSTLSEWMAKKQLKAEDVVIARAELVVEMQNFSDFDIKNYPDSLGAFTLQNTYYNIGCLASFYNSALFNGTKNATLKKYSMNITRDIHYGIRKKRDTKFYLSPYSISGSGQSYDPYQYYLKQSDPLCAVLKGTKNSKPIKLIISYSKPR